MSAVSDAFVRNRLARLGIDPTRIHPSALELLAAIDGASPLTRAELVAELRRLELPEPVIVPWPEAL